MGIKITGLAKLKNMTISTATGGAPTISSFSPTSGATGTSITITGTNLGGTTNVQFNGVSSTSLSGNTSTSVTATVPAGATNGVITVVTPSGSANTSALTPSDFTVGSGATFTVSQLDFTAYSAGSSLVVFSDPYHPVYNDIPYTWDPVNDIHFVLNPTESVTVQITMSGYTGAVTGTTYTTSSGEYLITAVGQSGSLYTFTVTNTFTLDQGASTIPETLTFTVTDSVSATGTYSVSVIDIFS